MAATEFKPDFTIGMATFRNFDEVFFTVQALRFFNPELMKRFEILIVDNDPTSKDGKAIKALMEGRTAPNGRYIAWDKIKGSVPPRAEMIRQARGRFVVCIDSHVLLLPANNGPHQGLRMLREWFGSNLEQASSLDPMGRTHNAMKTLETFFGDIPTTGAGVSALQCLADYFDANPKSDDFIQGPLVSNYGPHRLEGSHMIPRWRSGMFGTWGVDQRAKDPNSEPFEIEEHGLGLFAIRKASFLGFRDDFVGFSGGEGYIHEKYRQAGRRCLCLPGARWIHKFSRPHGIPHRPITEDKIKNHIRGWMELGVDLATGDKSDPIASIANHFVGGGRIPAETFSQLAADVGVPNYVVKISTPRGSGAVIGPTSWGSFGMRGNPLVERFGFDRYNSRAKIDPAGRRYETIIAVKCDIPPVLRRVSKRLIFDPLDKWFVSNRESDKSPAQWLADEFVRNRFTDLIAATIPLKDAARRGLPKSVRVHLVPHQADSRIGLDWYDPDGPVVYCGMSKFIEPALPAVRAACERLGRPFVFDTDHHAWKSLKGASLVLAPRVGLRSRMNLQCKPAVKIANSAQAGIPVLATDDPAITSLYSDVRTAPAADWLEPKKLADLIEAALGDSAPTLQTPFDRWLERMKGILE
jgi:hypothetical protein